MNASDMEKISSLDLYEILDIPKNCNVSKIKKSYKRLVLTFHPDKSGSDTSEEFELINLAYTILKDEKLRNLYDKERDSYINSRDFSELKNNKKNINRNIPDNEDDALIQFRNLENELNLKHEFNKNDIGVISSNEISKRLQNLKFNRTQEDDNFKNNFNKLNVNKSEFNEIFLNRNDRNLEECRDIVSFNEMNMELTNYSNVNENNLYSVNGDSSNWYSSFDKAFKSNIPKSAKNDYYSHNQITSSEKANIERQFNLYKKNIF